MPDALIFQVAIAKLQALKLSQFPVKKAKRLSGVALRGCLNNSLQFEGRVLECT